MKIGIVIWDLTVSGGTQRQALELAKSLSKKHEIYIYAYAFDPKACYPELVKGLRIKSLSSSTPQPKPRNSGGWLFRLYFDTYLQFHPIDKEEKLFGDFIDEGCDVLNIHDYHTEKAAVFYKKRFPNTKIVWMVNDMPNTFQLLRDMRPRLRKNIFALNRQLLSWLIAGWHARRELEAIRQIDRIVALGKKNQRWIKKYMGRSSVAVASGLDAKQFTPQFNKNNQVFTILAVGILFPMRRYDLLIKAVGILAEKNIPARLKIVGTDQFNPDYGRQLQKLAKELGLSSSIEFLGKVSDSQLSQLYRESDVFVLCSESQTWGLAPFEAMASGTPVIINEQAGAADWMKRDEHALFVPPNDEAKLADKLLLLHSDSGLRARLAHNGRKFVEENISWEKYADTMLEIFNG